LELAFSAIRSPFFLLLWTESRQIGTLIKDKRAYASSAFLPEGKTVSCVIFTCFDVVCYHLLFFTVPIL
jgi:hypothetical protein